MWKITDIISRICVLAGCAFAEIYGTFSLVNKKMRKYFTMAFVGIFAIFLSRLFYFILTISNGNDAAFSVGVFGQIAAYMFFTLANTSYMPKHRFTHNICFKGAVAAIIPAAVFIYVAFKAGTASAFFCEGLYVICLCSSVYYSTVIITERKKNEICRSVVPFNNCVCGLVYANAANEILLLFNEGFVRYIALGLAVISGIVIAVMLPLLKSGVEQWEA